MTIYGVKSMDEKTEQKLHPSVITFKEFINKNPKLRREIRKSGRSWQEYYEKWVLLGEDDVYWEQFKEVRNTKEKETNSEQKAEDKAEKKTQDMINQLLKLGENIDFNKIQGQVANLSKTIGVFQELVDQYQQAKSHQQTPKKQGFKWFQD